MAKRGVSNFGALQMKLAAKLTLTIIAVSMIPMIGGCAKERPLFAVKADADNAYASGRYGQAAVYYQQFIERKPHEADIRLRLGESLLETGKPRLAREHLSVAYDLQPENPDAIELLAKAMYEAGDTTNLYGFLRDVADQNKGVNDRLRLGYYAVRLGHVDEAHQALTTAAIIDRGKSIEPQIALAEFYRRISDDQNELNRWRMVLFLDPEHPSAINRIREFGHVPGPSFALPPAEARATANGG